MLKSMKYITEEDIIKRDGDFLRPVFAAMPTQMTRRKTAAPLESGTIFGVCNLRVVSDFFSCHSK